MKKNFFVLLAAFLCLICALMLMACKKEVEPPAPCQHSDADGNEICDQCGQSYVDDTDQTNDEKTPCTTHILAYYEPKEATCSTNGCVEYWACTACGKYFSDENATVEIKNKSSVRILATGIHVFTDKTSTDAYLKSHANCESPDVYYYKCENCDAKGGETDVYTIGDERHDFTVRVETNTYLKSEADCRNCAIYYYKCSLCDAYGESTYETGKKLEHALRAEGDKYVCTECSNAYRMFGEYPQTLKEAHVNVTETQDSRGYYMGSDGAYYAKVTADPCGNGYKFSNGSDITKGESYYFKVEPILWLVLEQSDGTELLLCDSIIANKAFDQSSNNYAESDVREWLNGELYNMAFSTSEKALIQPTTVDNGTSHQIFLLSYAELNVHAAEKLPRASRQMKTSDYCRATGILISKNTEEYGYGNWWLRTPTPNDPDGAQYVMFDGILQGNGDVFNSSNGVLPALRINATPIAD